MKSRFAALAAMAAAALLLGGVCGKKLYPPEFISVPSEVHSGDTAWVRLAASGRGYDSVCYVVNWGDATVDTSEPYSLNDVASMWHVWTAPDTVYVRAAVYSPDDPQGIRWAEQSRVFVDAGSAHAPVIDTVLLNQGVAVKGAATLFTVRAHDPDGDSVRLRFDWGATETTTAYFASPCSVSVSHIFTEVETALVSLTAQDTRGATSSTETLFVPVGLAGGVIWYRLGRCWTSPLVASDGSEECIYCSIEEYPEDAPIFRALGVTGGVKHTFGGTAALIGEPACCAATGHVIIGGDGGEFYALGMSLVEAWDWLNVWWRRWGPMAISGTRMYLKTDDDSIYYFIDSITSGVHVAAFEPGGVPSGAPVVDAQGNVYFGTDSGYLYKMGPELDSVFWHPRLIANGKVDGPIVGSDGTIYCGSDSFRLYAVEPDGTIEWTVTLDGTGARPALGRSALFVGTDQGSVYSLNPQSGVIIWQKSLGQGVAFITTPIVAANGYVYFQSDNDVLYCINQSDGTMIWACDCSYYLPGGGRSGSSHRPGKTHLTDYPPNPTILSNGDIIVAGQSALFCVAGAPEGSLDPLAPWPKWQHDLHNTGYVGGGR